MRRLRPLPLLALLAALGGCAVYPAGPGYYSPPAASVYVAPRPYYYAPRPYYGGWGARPYGGYGYGYGGYRRW
ncbi:hypothetical protein [Paracraurococcus ruber]|uniref:Lipoprotein n=1 Tax=Paracraurococcus ruber TaxID=77675 RepID=A0ABS1D597_9PROT|nr:hypothetical protein [Paracraurococcus ruber]MBK1662055.1 hypothetical protein [Paracraurococcus ruber]TDG27233.1 hypothetical protein E2C05_23615 [Paracraurococcus ruber]